MYIVLLGTPDSELGQIDFTAYGPFETKREAARWVNERETIVGVDGLDTPFFIALSDPAQAMQELRD